MAGEFGSNHILPVSRVSKIGYEDLKPPQWVERKWVPSTINFKQTDMARESQISSKPFAKIVGVNSAVVDRWADRLTPEAFKLQSLLSTPFLVFLIRYPIRRDLFSVDALALASILLYRTRSTGQSALHSQDSDACRCRVSHFCYTRTTYLGTCHGWYAVVEDPKAQQDLFLLM